jgi:hypothetical protein
MVGVIVRPGPLSPGSAAKIAEIRAQMLAAVTAADARHNTAFAWGRMADDAVLLLDPGPAKPESAGPVGTQQNGPTGRADLRPESRSRMLRGRATGADAARDLRGSPSTGLSRCSPPRSRWLRASAKGHRR